MKRNIAADVAKFEGLVNLGELTELRRTIHSISTSFKDILHLLIHARNAAKHLSAPQARMAAKKAADVALVVIWH